MERLANPTECPQPAKAPRTKAKPSGFVITIRCLDDGERVTLRTARGPWGLTVSATNCARKVAAVLQHYRAAS